MFAMNMLERPPGRRNAVGQARERLVEFAKEAPEMVLGFIEGLWP